MNVNIAKFYKLNNGILWIATLIVAILAITYSSLKLNNRNIQDNHVLKNVGIGFTSLLIALALISTVVCISTTWCDGTSTFIIFLSLCVLCALNFTNYCYVPDSKSHNQTSQWLPMLTIVMNSIAISAFIMVMILFFIGIKVHG